jgi:hypothetical protein
LKKSIQFSLLKSIFLQTTLPPWLRCLTFNFKGIASQYLLLQVFAWISSPLIKRYSMLLVSHWCQWRKVKQFTKWMFSCVKWMLWDWILFTYPLNLRSSFWRVWKLVAFEIWSVVYTGDPLDIFLCHHCCCSEFWGKFFWIKDWDSEKQWSKTCDTVSLSETFYDAMINDIIYNWAMLRRLIQQASAFRHPASQSGLLNPIP